MLPVDRTRGRETLNRFGVYLKPNSLQEFRLLYERNDPWNFEIFMGDTHFRVITPKKSYLYEKSVYELILEYGPRRSRREIATIQLEMAEDFEESVTTSEEGSESGFEDEDEDGFTSD